MSHKGFSNILTGIIIAVVPLGVGGYLFISQKSQEPSPSVEKYTGPMPTPLYRIDAATNFRFAIEVLINGGRVATAKPPRELFSGATVNEHLKTGENILAVKYEVLPMDPEHGAYGPVTFHVEIKQQTDWKDPATAKLLVSVRGPTEPFPPVGTRGTETATFVVSSSVVSSAEEPATTQAVGRITDTHRKKIFTIIKQLHAAYSAKDTDKILKLTRERNKAAAKTYGQTFKAFEQFERQYMQQLFSNPKWRMKPLRLGDNVKFAVDGNKVVVSGQDPILASPRITIQGGFLIVEYSRFVFQKSDADWILVDLQ